ncbi:hypothetical protein J7L02_02645 [Candidatus Woesearchaeota archaeon]|nr:hypothetical protein [Candidatus Woesearchaeota archaeon]
MLEKTAKIKSLDELLKEITLSETGPWRREYEKFRDQARSKDSEGGYKVVIKDFWEEVSGYGLDYFVQVIVTEKQGSEEKTIYNFGPLIYRHGVPELKDDFSIAYRKAKILKADSEGLVLALESSEAIKILEISKDGTSRVVESYDLKEEKKAITEKTVLEKTVKELDEESFKDYLRVQPGIGGRIVYSDEDLMIGVVPHYDRDYDARVTSLTLYVVLKDQGIATTDIYLDTHHPDARFYSVDGSVKDLQVEKLDGEVKIKGIARAVYNPVRGPSKEQFREEFEITVKQ